MSIWSRITNIFCGERLTRDIDAELQSHLDDAVASGRDPAEARRAFGSTLRYREESRDTRLMPRLDALRADVVFGWRQLRKNRVTSAAAIVSLALAIGACTSAFRLIDAVLLRPLPVDHPERLYGLFRQSADSDGKPKIDDSYEYPLFVQMRSAVKASAELIAVSYTDRADITYGATQDVEKAYVQNVSGWMFPSFGIQPALGRLLTENDDRTPGAHPYAVLSNDYWNRRFARDPKIVGRTFRLNDNLYEIVGVTEAPFTGTEPGIMTDVFIPMAMHAGVTHADWSWFRALVHLKEGAGAGPVRDRLRATYRAYNDERAKQFAAMPKKFIDRFFRQTLLLEPAGGGISRTQQDYREALAALAVLVALVLLIACANVANLMTAQAAARSREMAMRVSIGAGRWRLVQLVLVESALLGVLAAALGAVFAWWSAPFVAGRINPPDNPVRLVLSPDWRVAAFGLALTVAVMILFGISPALRASSVKPASALRGGDPHSRRRLMHGLIAAQVAFCFLVLFVAGLFITTLNRLSSQPTGFSADRLVNLDTLSPRMQPVSFWDQAVDHLRTVPGVESVALAAWPLLSGVGMNGVVAIHGAEPVPDLVYFLNISPGWMDTMKIPLIAGRDFRATDVTPGAAIVNQAFAKHYFNGADPIGKLFEKVEGNGRRTRFQVVGLAANARYRNMREPITPTAYIPIHSVDAAGVPQPRSSATFIVRTASSNPLAMAAVLRHEVTRARPEFRVTNMRTQVELNQSHTIRERLLAMLALFFAAVSLILAGVGLYGVLDYSVLQRRREIGILMAIGAPATDVMRRVTTPVFSMVFVGAFAGLGLGLAATRWIESLLYGVKGTDVGMLVFPALTILGAAILAALPAVVRAVRIDPVAMLRSE